MPSSAWRELLLEPRERRHFVLVHQTDGYLASCVAAWAARSLTTGGGAVLVGRTTHLELILREIRILGVDAAARIASGRLILLDAVEVIRSLLDERSMPDRDAFRSLAADAIAGVRRACGNADAEVRAWGEMVSLLQEDARPEAARALEEIWEEILSDAHCRLLCSYRLAGLRSFEDACHEHSTLVVEAPHDIDGTAARVMTDLFGQALPGPALTHIMRRGGVPLGGSPPSAFLLPLDDWRPVRVA